MKRFKPWFILAAFVVTLYSADVWANDKPLTQEEFQSAVIKLLEQLVSDVKELKHQLNPFGLKGGLGTVTPNAPGGIPGTIFYCPPDSSGSLTDCHPIKPEALEGLSDPDLFINPINPTIIPRQ